MNTPNDPNDGKGGETSAQKIAASIQGMGDWRGETLARIRALIARKKDYNIVATGEASKLTVSSLVR